MQNINIYSSGVIFKYALQPPPTHIPLDTNQVSSPFNRGQSIGIAQEGELSPLMGWNFNYIFT